jgi:dolichol-phosphate mannosyltransferase
MIARINDSAAESSDLLNPMTPLFNPPTSLIYRCNFERVASMLIIPTYNERENIAPLVTRIRQALEKEPIFFVDDNSPDHTADEIRNMQRSDSQIHLMARPAKGGYGSACRDAMKMILRENLADYIIQSDADLSHPPELLPRMIDLLNMHPVVIGSRYVAGAGTQGWSIPRRLLSFGANLYARALTGVPVHDMTAGFVGYQANILRRINLGDIRSEGYAFLMEMKFSLHRQGVEFVEFPIVFSERESGSSKFSRKILFEGMKFPLQAAAKRL